MKWQGLPRVSLPFHATFFDKLSFYDKKNAPGYFRQRLAFSQYSVMLLVDNFRSGPSGVSQTRAEIKEPLTTNTRCSSSIPTRKSQEKELDLDYLERKGGDTWGLEITDSTSKEEENPADSLKRVKVVFLGARGVGKSSIIRQFVCSKFSEEYRPTETRETYHASVVLAERLYEVKITDLPTITYFPVSSHLEWTDFRYYGLRSATAYVLVFDLSNQDTFQYIRMLREQIYEARDMRGVPLLVVGNKQDKLSASAAPGTRHRDIVNLVRKHWRCGYVECSAKYNCRVVQVFRELVKSVQAVEGKPSSPTSTISQTMRANQQIANEKCVLL